MTDTTAIDPRERIDRYLSASGLSQRSPRVVALSGDASDRRYYRLLFDDGETAVVAVHTGPIEYTTLPFANVSGLLAAVPLPIPGIIGHSDPDGILMLEDLGDVTLQAHLGAVSPLERDGLYREAIALIERLQRRGQELVSNRFLPYGIAFDVDKLVWELNFFVKHFVEGYRGAAISPATRAALDEEWAAIAGELAAEARVLCHRDYHSRNLMVRDSRLFIIDFQDARLGPDTYDLASLLRDSYCDIDEQGVDSLIGCFLAIKGGGDPLEFRRRFDVMSLQRNLKALGTFGFQTTTRDNPVYIQYMPRTLRYAVGNLKK